MPQEPKKRHSRARQGKRRSAIKLALTSLIECPNCGKPMHSHSVCKNCGFYKGKDILGLSKKNKKEEAPATPAPTE